MPSDSGRRPLLLTDDCCATIISEVRVGRSPERLPTGGVRRARPRPHQRVRERLRERPGPVDALLVTGDIADHGAQAEYEEATRVLGPHDRARPSRCSSARQPRQPDAVPHGPAGSVRGRGAGQQRMSATTAPCRCADSSVPGSDEGAPGRGAVRLDRGDARRTRRGPSGPVGLPPPAGRPGGAAARDRRADHRSRAPARRHPRVRTGRPRSGRRSVCWGAEGRLTSHFRMVR